MKGVVIEQKAFEKLLSKINLLTDAINFINQTIQKEIGRASCRERV